MELIETAVFTRHATALWDDEEYREFQSALIQRPDMGAPIVGGGGLRKVRWGVGGRGKRGGVRIIYYWVREDHQIFLLIAYDKHQQERLSKGEIAQLRKLVEED